MIRNDLKEKLGKDWRSKFSHRDCDQADYEFGKFEVDGKKINLVLNPKTVDIMEYYYDDFDENTWIEINKNLITDFNTTNRAWINKKYQLKTQYYVGKRLTTRIRDLKKVKVSKRSRYPNINIFDKSVDCHKLIALIFIPNQDISLNPIINHKDLNSNNFMINNLEWCSYSYNAKKENIKARESVIRYICIEENKIYTKTLILETYGTMSGFYNAIKKNELWKNYHWCIINLIIEDYLSRHKLTGKLHKHPTIPELFADECGILYFKNKITLGCFEKDKLSYRIQINNRQYYVHRLLIECYLGKIIPENLVVDHIIPVTEKDIDNSINNLHLVSIEDNMNNKLTRINLSKECYLYDLYGNFMHKEPSIDSMRKFLGISLNLSSITISTSDGSKFILARNKEELSYKIKFIYYKFDKNNTILDANIHLGSLAPEFRRPCDIIKPYLNTGMPAPNGFYYQQGSPNKMIYNPYNKDLKKEQEEIYWKNKSERLD